MIWFAYRYTLFIRYFFSWSKYQDKSCSFGVIAWIIFFSLFLAKVVNWQWNLEQSKWRGKKWEKCTFGTSWRSTFFASDQSDKQQQHKKYQMSRKKHTTNSFALLADSALFFHFSFSASVNVCVYRRGLWFFLSPPFYHFSLSPFQWISY